LPDRGPELVADPQGVVQAVLVALPARRLAAGQVLARHPPTRHLFRSRRIANVVDHQDVADVALHLGRDVGVALVDVEAVDAEAEGLVVGDQLRPGLVGDVVDPEPAVGIAALAGGVQHRDVVRGHAQLGRQLCIARRPSQIAGEPGPELRQARALAQEVTIVLLDVGEHQVADDPDLVGVGVAVGQLDRRDHLGLRRIRDVDDRGAVRRLHVADIGSAVLDHDLAAAGDVQVADALDVAGQVDAVGFRHDSHSAGSDSLVARRRRRL
jgi:hypothetical protein